MSNKRNNQPLMRIVGIGIFTALAVVISFATSFIKVGFLSLDAGDIVIILGSFIYGPLAGVIMSLISSLFGFLYSGTGIWGLLMDFASSAAFSFIASFIYSRKKSFKLAIVGIYSAVLSVTAIMMPLNILITPLYTGATTEQVISLIPVMLLPFNFAKCLFNGGAVLLLYKPIVRAMRAAHLVPPSSSPIQDSPDSVRRRGSTLPALLIGGVSVLLAVGALLWLALK
ncbi:MAG: ECF transporter S component [Clostridia bacterium]|nr:ECF transporter S component [Clostridia bacterium]